VKAGTGVDRRGGAPTCSPLGVGYLNERNRVVDELPGWYGRWFDGSGAIRLCGLGVRLEGTAIVEVKA
jgi:hypothetical protein